MKTSKIILNYGYFYKFLFIFTLFYFYNVVFINILKFDISYAQELEIPVSYKFTEDSNEIDGFLVGGTLCAPEGIIIREGNATASRVVEYEKINTISNIQPIGNKKVVMIVEMKDGHRFKCYADLDEIAPFIILQDEKDQKGTGALEKESSQNQSRGKKRIFNAGNFKGIYKINIEAVPVSEITEEEVLSYISKLAEAIKKDDIENAIDLYNKIGDYLESWQEEIVEDKDKK